MQALGGFKIGDKVKIHPKFNQCDWYNTETYTIIDLALHYFSGDINGRSRTGYATLDRLLFNNNTITLTGLCLLKEERRLKLKKLQTL